LPVFLHINKTGGGALRAVLQKFRRSHRVFCPGHFVSAGDNEDTVLFTVRDPIARFVSGFNSAHRRDNGGNWNPGEELLFPRYANANALAEAIFSETGARLAMRQISHIRRHQHSWFPGPAVEWLSANRSRVLWVGFTDSLAADFERLKERLNLPADLTLPVVHRAPDNSETFLSELARENLSRWYSEDIRFVEWLRKNP
jgi:hypothetical protein